MAKSGVITLIGMTHLCTSLDLEGSLRYFGFAGRLLKANDIQKGING
jgi:hypothetical protein